MQYNNNINTTIILSITSTLNNDKVIIATVVKLVANEHFIKIFTTTSNIYLILSYIIIMCIFS